MTRRARTTPPPEPPHTPDGWTPGIEADQFHKCQVGHMTDCRDFADNLFAGLAFIILVSFFGTIWWYVLI
jgi:hypothetical protein